MWLPSLQPRSLPSVAHAVRCARAPGRSARSFPWWRRRRCPMPGWRARARARVAAQARSNSDRTPWQPHRRPRAHRPGARRPGEARGTCTRRSGDRTGQSAEPEAGRRCSRRFDSSTGSGRVFSEAQGLVGDTETQQMCPGCLAQARRGYPQRPCRGTLRRRHVGIACPAIAAAIDARTSRNE